MDTVDNDDDRRKPASNPEPAAGLIPVIKVPERTGKEPRRRPGTAPDVRRERPEETAPLSVPGTGGLRSTKPKPPPATTSVPRLAKAAARKSAVSQAGAPAGPRPGAPARPGKPRARKTTPRQHSQTAAQRADSSSAAARRMLRRLVQGETPPTQAMSIVERLAGSPYANPRVRSGGPDASARKTLDLALSMAETMFRYGAGALEVETAMIAVTAAYGLDNIEVDITNQSVLLNYSPKDQTPITVMRVVRSWTNNYAGLALVHRLVTDIVDGNVSRAEAAQQLNTIVHQPKPFPRWAVTFSAGLFAAAIVAFIGSGPLGSAVAFFSTILVSLLQRLLGRWRVPDFFTTAASGFLVTALAMLFWALDATDSLELDIAPGIVVAGGILLLLPTGRLVSAVQDAIDGFALTAGGRILDLTMQTLGVVIGILVGLELGGVLGFTMDLPDDPAPFGPLLNQFAGAIIIAIAVAVFNGAGIRIILVSALLSAVTLAGYSTSITLNLHPAAASAIGALLASFLGMLIARNLHVPSVAVTTAAIVPLVPGVAVFQGLLEMVHAAGTSTGMLLSGGSLIDAAVIGIGLASGASLGLYLGTPVRATLASVAKTRARVRR